MSRQPNQPALIELDLDRYELRRGGIHVNLERIPMELLILLVKKQGSLATREEIVQSLWGKNPYLDTERNINTAISKVRSALRDQSDRPRFVETVVGKGYRFVYPCHPDFVIRQGRGEGQQAAKVVASASSPEPSPLESSPASLEPQSTFIPTASRVQGELSNLKSIDDRSSGETNRIETSARPASAATKERRPIRLGNTRNLAVAGIVVGLLAIFFFAVRRPVSPPKVEKYTRITNGGMRKMARIANLSLPVLTDGLRLYFSVPAADGKFGLAQVATGGGEVGTLPSPLDSPTPLAISPDSSEILLASPSLLMNDPVWIQPLTAGSPRRLGDIAALSAGWSPDGAQIAFANLSGLYIAHADGTSSQVLLKIDQRTGQEPYWIRWSPDGTRLRFSLYDPKTDLHSLWEISAGGGNLRQLFQGVPGPADICCGNWTADGKYFVYEALRDEGSDIWAMREKSGFFGNAQSMPTRLTEGPISFSAPVSSKDGKTLFAMGEEPRGELVRYDPKKLTFGPYLSGVSAMGADFSKDGNWAAYVSYPDRTLWRCRMDGSERTQLTFSPIKVSLPRWSPDGKQITFYARASGQPFKIYLISSKGGTPLQAMPGNRHEIDPYWSPDGSSLVFQQSSWEERGAVRETSIQILDLKTHQVSALPGSQGFASPRWSPDGRYIAAMPADSSGLVLFDLQRHNCIQLAKLHIGYPNWSHDGKYIYFDRFENPAGIGRVRISDHKVEQVATLQDDQQLWSLDTWTGLTPDDSPLVMHDVSIEEIYILQWTAP